MMVKLGDHDMGERSERSLAPRDRFYGCGCLHDLPAGAAAILGADGADDPPLDRHGVEHLVAVLAQGAQGAAAIWARAVAMLRLDPLLLTRQMGRERPNRCWPIGLGRIDARRAHRGGFGLELFECQLELQASLTLTLYSPKSHRLNFLRSQCEQIAPSLIEAWSRDDKFSLRWFELLRRAYVNARYSPHCEISDQELRWLGEHVAKLQALVKSVCEERLAPPGR